MAQSNFKRKLETVDLTQSDDELPESSQSRKYPRQQWHTETGPSNQHGTNERDRWSQSSQQNDGSEEIETSQDFDSNRYETLELYGVLETKIVGVRYYNGQATAGEFVIIRREPANPYDYNAIRIDNVMGHQIGHIGRNVAAKLAPFMDSKSLVFEGQLTGRKGEYDMPISLRMFGTSDRVAQLALKEQMKEKKLPINELVRAERERKNREKEAERQKQLEREKSLKQAAQNASLLRKGGSIIQFENEKSKGWANLGGPDGENNDDEEGPSMDEILSNTTTFNPRELGEVVDKYGASEEKLSSLPKAKQPADLATKMLPYQLQGLAWMLDRENPVLPATASTETVQLWKKTSSGMFTNIATNYTTRQPKLASGGILADDMGLGKTIQIISLLLADPKRSNKPTLIIAPLSVMSNWSGQIQSHLKPECALRVLTYHGSGRSEDFAQHDVVVTTYQTMAREWMPAGKGKPAPIPRKSGLYSVNWRRVVLDEGHNIRNPRAKMSLAACALLSDSRWVLTGTPIVNNLRDLYSHVRFLGLSGGLEQQDVFSGVLIRPLNQGRQEASILLQALISTLCLRRMKDMKFVDLRLPELTQHKYTVSWLPEEREKYDAFQAEAKGLLLKYQSGKSKNGENTYSHLLEVLLRLRQTCNHWRLCEERINSLMSQIGNSKTVALNQQNLKTLRDLLQLSVDSQEDCPVCLDSLHNPVITTCAHVFGSECIERVIETQQKCPMCRAELTDTSAIVQPSAGLGEQHANIDISTSSTKVEALLSILKASAKKPGTKTVVFSQWTSFLDVIQRQLKVHSIAFCRLDGTMPAAQRDDAMAALASDPACCVMLASLHVCSVGLNLTAANQVVLADSWWAPAIEDQAVDRVHRLGQTRPTTVFRLVMEDSVEEQVLEVQQEKRQLMMTAFQEKTMKRGNEKAARLADIEKLLK